MPEITVSSTAIINEKATERLGPISTGRTIDEKLPTAILIDYTEAISTTSPKNQNSVTTTVVANSAKKMAFPYSLFYLAWNLI